MRLGACSGHQQQGGPYPPPPVNAGLAAWISHGFMPAAHHLPNPFGPNSAGGTIATELAVLASRHSSPGIGGGLGQVGNRQNAHTLYEWPVACTDTGVTHGGCREVGRKSRRGGSESRSPEVSMHSCSGADLGSLDSPCSLRHGGSSTDSLTAHHCQVRCSHGGRPACASVLSGFKPAYGWHIGAYCSISMRRLMHRTQVVQTSKAPMKVRNPHSMPMLFCPSAGGGPRHRGAADPRRRRAAAGLRGGSARGKGAGGKP